MLPSPNGLYYGVYPEVPRVIWDITVGTARGATFAGVNGGSRDRDANAFATLEASVVGEMMIDQDILAIERSEAVQTILQVLRRATGMRVALIARVTDSSWTACAVLDEANFGVKVGDRLPLDTTF